MHSDKLQTLLFQKMSTLYDLAVHLFMVLLYIRSLKMNKFEIKKVKFDFFMSINSYKSDKKKFQSFGNTT